MNKFIVFLYAALVVSLVATATALLTMGLEKIPSHEPPILHSIAQEQTKCITENITHITIYNETTYNTEYNYNLLEFPIRKYRECGRHATKLYIHGQSMHPLVSEGYVYVEPVKWRNLELGDVINFQMNGNPVFHAIIYLNFKDNVGLTAGYNNIDADDWYITSSMKYERYCVKK
jgi:hypothetical protein